MKEFEDAIVGWPDNIPSVHREVVSYKSTFENDAIIEEEWLISNGVSAEEAFRTADNHLFRRVVSFVAQVINSEYKIYDNFSTHFNQAFEKLGEYEKYSYKIGPKPNFDVIDLFGECQVAQMAIINEFVSIQQTFYPALENEPNLHISFDLITPFLAQSQEKLLDWIKTILGGFSDRLVKALRKLKRDEEADTFQPVQLGMIDFRRLSNFNAHYLESFEMRSQSEIDEAVAVGVSYHEALATAENKFSDRVVDLLKFTINSEYKFYDVIAPGFANSVSKVEAFEAYADGTGPKPSSDLYDIQKAIYEDYSELNSKYFNVQYAIEQHVAAF